MAFLDGSTKNQNYRTTFTFAKHEEQLMKIREETIRIALKENMLKYKFSGISKKRERPCLQPTIFLFLFELPS